MQSCATISDTFDNFPLCLTSTLRVKDLLISYGILKGARTEFSFEKTCCKRRRGCARVCTKHPRLSKTKNLFIYITEKSEWKSKQLTLMSSTCSSPRSSAVLQKAVTTRSPERIATFFKPCFFSLDCRLLVSISAKVTWLSSSVENFSSFLLSLPCLPGSSSLPQTLVLSPSKLSF